MTQRWVSVMWWTWVAVVELLVLWTVLNEPNTITWVCFVIVQVVVATGRAALRWEPQ